MHGKCCSQVVFESWDDIQTHVTEHSEISSTEHSEISNINNSVIGDAVNAVIMDGVESDNTFIPSISGVILESSQSICS